MKRTMQKISLIAIVVVSFLIHHGAAGEKRPLVVFAGPNLSSIAFKMEAEDASKLLFSDKISDTSRDSAAGFTAGMGFKPQSFPGATLTLGYTYHGKFTPELTHNSEFLGFPMQFRLSGPLHVHALDLVGRWEIFDNDNAFQPYLSIALGAAHVKGEMNLSANVVGYPGVSTPYYNFKKTAVTGGAGGGFRYAVTDKISLTTEYIFQASSTMKQSFDGMDYSLRMGVHKFSLGVNVTF